MNSQATKDTKVKFYPAAKLRMYPMPNEEDRHLAWYSREDFRSFRKERAETIRTLRMLGIHNLGIEQAELLSMTTMGLRGDLSSEQRRIRELRRDSLLYYVLKEQQRQYRNGIYDSEAIAMSCRHISEESSIEAQEEGRRARESCLKGYAESTFEQKLCPAKECKGLMVGATRAAVIIEHTNAFPRNNVTRSATAA